MTTIEFLEDRSMIDGLIKARRVLNRDSMLIEPIRTEDHPGGFGVLVTEHVMQWRVPWDADYGAFEDAGVSFVRV